MLLVVVFVANTNYRMSASPPADVVSEDHPDTLKSLYNLALLFDSKGDYDRALPMYEECLAKRKRVLGEDHPDTLSTLNGLAILFRNRRDYDRALPIYEECLAKRKRVLGEDHPHTKDTQKWRDICAQKHQASRQ